MVKLDIPMPNECQECPCYNKADCRVLRLLHKPYYAPDIFSHTRYKECPMEEIKDPTRQGVVTWASYEDKDDPNKWYIYGGKNG